MSVVEGAFCRSAPWRAFTRRVALPWVLQGRELRNDVVEVGCGPGANAQAIVERFPDIRLTATDVDDLMVAAARQRLAPVDPDVIVCPADITELPFGDESVDAVVSLLMLHHVIDWEAGLAECARVLRPGGSIVGYDLLDTMPARLVHRLDRSRHLMIPVDELETCLLDLGMSRVRVAPGLGGLVARFSAVKPDATA